MDASNGFTARSLDGGRPFATATPPLAANATEELIELAAAFSTIKRELLAAGMAGPMSYTGGGAALRRSMAPVGGRSRSMSARAGGGGTATNWLSRSYAGTPPAVGAAMPRCWTNPRRMAATCSRARPASTSIRSACDLSAATCCP
ncbi:hypothetical protein Vafri_3749 [Volvox africanus]|uniref:Uncharacterized protein n=1 Tax=Volvox africanus TaxID=51714 RepID=A0A8J4EV53_9CHLO|nr:hypothetical protein Vafri_3749 [Volvox africanus]